MFVRSVTSFRLSTFKLSQVTPLRDFNVELVQYENGVGARLYHMKCNDEHKAFATVFRSQVSNSRGTPHILEHILCCGSEAYPIRDPFMALSKRSLNSYMNAWTGPDFIAFPFSTINQQDFQNLLDVYLNMIFKPLLRLQDFRQEGWRLELNPSPEIKGVVFNEMKGHFQSADNVFHGFIHQYVLHGTEYAYVFGGDPHFIPELKHEELLRYYNTTFDPSGATFFVYGNVEIESVQTKIEAYLTQQGNLNKVSEQTIQPITIPSILPLPPSIDTESNQAQLSFTYILRTQLNSDPITSMAFNVIQSVLFEPFAGVLYKKLIETGLVDAFGKMAGTESYGKYSLFNMAFSGVAHDRQTVEEIREIINQALSELVQQGLPQDMVEGQLHQIELQTKTPSSHQGIRLLEMGLNSLAHRLPLIDHLSVSSNLTELRRLIKSGYLEQLIDGELLKNTQCYTLYAQPDQRYLKELVRNEQDLVQNLMNELDAAQREQLNSLNEELNNLQNVVQDLNLLPTVHVRDIERLERDVVVDSHEYEKVKIHFVKENTNGMTFLRLKFNLGKITKGFRQYLQMFCTFVTRIGTERLKSEELTKVLNLCSSGFEASFDSFCDISDPDVVHTFLLIKIQCLDGKISEMITVLAEILTEPLFEDVELVASILRNQSSAIQTDLLEQGLSYAKCLAHASVREHAFITDMNFQNKFFINYASKFDKASGSDKSHYLDDFNFQMVSMMNYVMKQQRLEVIVHSASDLYMREQVQRLIDALSTKYQGFAVPTEDRFIASEHRYVPCLGKFIITVPSQVNFVVAAMRIPHLLHNDTAPLAVMSQVLGNTVLHREVREKGGAYGAGSSVRGGILDLWSYRDPNIMKTVEVYEKLELSVSGEELDSAKLTLFQKYDQPQEPQSKGLAELLYGTTRQVANMHRSRLLDTTVNDVSRVFEQYMKERSYGVFGSAEHEDIGELRSRGWKVENFLE